jgi:hypothetical protein
MYAEHIGNINPEVEIEVDINLMKTGAHAYKHPLAIRAATLMPQSNEMNIPHIYVCLAHYVECSELVTGK